MKYDAVNRPAHYAANGPFECIELTERYDFCIGNAIKYVWRHLDKGHAIEDLHKALWYVNREIKAHGLCCEVPGTREMLWELEKTGFQHVPDFWDGLYYGDLELARLAILARIDKLETGEAC